MSHKILEELLKSKGASLVGFCKLDASPIKNQPHLRYAISIAVKLSDSVLRTIDKRPSIMYFQHYRTVNYRLDQICLDCVKYLEDKGFDAFPIAGSQSKPTDKFSGVFQHKTAARLAGLGYIGKNSMFITPEYGSKVRLATILTDMPLESTKPIIHQNCGDCTICQNACPVGCIYGDNFNEETPHLELFDKEKCSNHMKTYQDVGRGAVCGLCFRACPKNKLDKSFD